MRNALASRRSWASAATTLGIVAIGVALASTRMAGPLGFMPLAASFPAFMAAAAIGYLGWAEVMKRLPFTPTVVRAANG